eukprot:1547162-Pyramimonas_sp.AAC.1
MMADNWKDESTHRDSLPNGLLVVLGEHERNQVAHVEGLGRGTLRQIQAYVKSLSAFSAETLPVSR